ncbi:MAG: hypothetical protein OEQ13_03015 [Acidobacteriota bacterium]|nr:hypothetical protein [Acidobacteriota bacterium]
MMNWKSGIARGLSALAFTGVVAFGIVALTTPVDAKPKKPPILCGPTILFECTFRDGSTQQVGLTQCEVARYEKKNKATCVPAS